jgi:NADPH-dependent glutamate synthase beta subunit-like oxidoreductase
MEKPYAITVDSGSSRANKTGAWRTERATYANRMPPCNDACPAGEDVQAWLYEAESGGDGYEQAWRKLMEDNPFPAIMGRVCYHPCETACNRAQLDEAVGINSVERFVGDEAIRAGWQVEPEADRTGRRVLVVGAGPAGLAAAYHLARRGHDVTIKEAAPKPGGMMRYGIPAYRLPRDVLDAEIQRILDLGVTLEPDAKVTDLAAVEGDYDAIFLAVGAQLGRRAYIPAGSAARMLDAVTMLRDLEKGERPLLGRRVAVYGGGNTAIDAARTAKRLGASDAIVVYRRTRDRMPAHESEVVEAEDEGVLFRWLSTVKEVGPHAMLVERMELDEAGRPQPTGEVEELSADALVLALGQEADLSLVEGVAGLAVHDGVLDVGPELMTGRAGVFAGGDMVPAERSVTVAVGHGMRAARRIDAWLSDVAPGPGIRRAPATFDSLNTWYYTDAPRTHRPRLEAVRRASTFNEVVLGHDEKSALLEARRCLSCGNCFGCDNCYGVCPDNAVIKTGEGAGAYLIDLDYCKGCGICAAECPAGAITMVPEEI